jgi:hypothetical protein
MVSRKSCDWFPGSVRTCDAPDIEYIIDAVAAAMPHIQFEKQRLARGWFKPESHMDHTRGLISIHGVAAAAAATQTTSRQAFDAAGAGSLPRCTRRPLAFPRQIPHPPRCMCVLVDTGVTPGRFITGKHSTAAVHFRLFLCVYTEIINGTSIPEKHADTKDVWLEMNIDAIWLTKTALKLQCTKTD